MAQTSEHLQWVDLREFGGLWTAGASSMMPANKQQVMSGCHPQPGGGVRAFLKVTDTVASTALQTTYLSLPGAATAYASAPDEASFDITGDIDLRALIAPDDWTPAVNNAVLGNLDAVGFDGYELQVASDGKIQIVWGNNAANLTMTSTVATGFTDGTKHWIRATLDVDDGGGNRVAKFYTSENGFDWTQLGTTVTTAGATSISASAQVLRVGGRFGDTLPMTGKVYRATVLSGIAGTVVANPAFTGTLVADTTVTDDLGNVFTRAGTATFALDTAIPIITGLGIISKTGAFATAAAPTFFIVTTDSGASPLANWNLWRWEKDEAETRWRLSATAPFAGLNSVAVVPPAYQPMFARARITATGASELFIALGLREAHAGATDGGSGVHRLSVTTGLVEDTLYSAAIGGYGSGVILTEHQARLVAGDLDSVRFTEPGGIDLTGATSGLFKPGPTGFLLSSSDALYEGSVTTWFVSVPPGDLFVATRDGRIHVAQGDLGDPSIRELGRWTSMLPQEPATTPNGIFFILPNQGVARLGLDGSVDIISQDILPAVWNMNAPKVGLGQLSGNERYLFCPNLHETTAHKNGALVFDTATGAWFTSTHTDDYTITNPKFMQDDGNARDGGVWVAQGPATASPSSALPVLFHYRTGSYDSASVSTEPRAATYEFKTAPLRDPSGRRVVIREVEIPAYSFDSGGPVLSTLAVTVNGTTITRSLPPGRSTQVFRFRETGEFLDVAVKAKSNTASLEAPMVESLRFGWRPGPMIR